MSNLNWTSRFGNLGRFSPFVRSPQQSGSAQVSDADFSYITADDLRKHDAASVSAVTDQPQSESPTDYGPPRETDVLVLRAKKKDIHIHFAAYSIAKSELVIGQVRDAAAKKLTGGDLRRIKLLYRGKTLKDDARSCRQEGLRDGSELLCTVIEAGSESDDGSESEDGSSAIGVEGDREDGEGTKKKRNRGKRTKRRNRREAAEGGTGTSTPEQERYLHPGVPLSQTSTRQESRTPSRAPSPKPPTSPATPLDKLDALRNALMAFEPEVDAFVRDPPSDPAKRDFEHKRLSETIFTKVQLKLDAVETEGDEDARMRRKELVKETLGVLGRLDGVMKK